MFQLRYAMSRHAKFPSAEHFLCGVPRSAPHATSRRQTRIVSDGPQRAGLTLGDHPLGHACAHANTT